MTNIITRFNFEKMYPKIKKSIEESTFMAIDCEFSGLLAKNSKANSFFDTAEERYQKYRFNMTEYIPLQLGITTYKYVKEEYTAETFTFYLMPRECGSVEPTFKFQSSAITFLNHFDFDYNKVFYEGISYLNRKNEAELLDGDLYIDEELFVDRVNELIGKDVTEDLDPKLLYLLRKRIESSEKNVITYYDGELSIRKFTDSNEYKAELSRRRSPTSDLIQSMIGFTRIFRLITESKKPIIGHNMYLDLIVLYHHFENELPSSYLKFKTEMNRLFPIVYDTKYLSYILNKLPRPYPIKDTGKIENRIPEKNEQWPCSSLAKLYDYFISQKGVTRFKYGTPGIVSTGEDGSFHNAGWDSYCTGFCFINLATVFVSSHYGTHMERVVGSMEMFKLVDRFVNRINVIHGGVLYMDLAKKDPDYARCLLFATKLRTGQGVLANREISDIDLNALRNALSSYGALDIQKLPSKTNLILAVGNEVCADKILKNYKKQTKIWKIEKYNRLKHMRVIRWLQRPSNLVWYVPLFGSCVVLFYARKYIML